MSAARAYGGVAAHRGGDPAGLGVEGDIGQGNVLFNCVGLDVEAGNMGIEPRAHQGLVIGRGVAKLLVFREVHQLKVFVYASPHLVGGEQQLLLVIVGQLPQGIAGTGGDDQGVQQLLRANGLRIADAPDGRMSGQALHLGQEGFRRPEAGICRLTCLGDDGEDRLILPAQLCKLFKNLLMGAEGAA
jgi:hypothetical protein